MSTLTIESTALPEVHPREVVRCRRCTLVQFRTMSDLCRRCDHPLPPPPRLDLEPIEGSNQEESRAVNGGRKDAGSTNRRKTARELTIGRKLRVLRDQRHLTQQDMAAKAQVPRTYISRIENARLLPGPVMLQRIAEALGVEILDLLPPGGNLACNGSAVEDVFWTALSESFVRLRPDQMALVLDRVRNMAGDRASAPVVPMHAAV